MSRVSYLNLQTFYQLLNVKYYNNSFVSKGFYSFIKKLINKAIKYLFIK